VQGIETMRTKIGAEAGAKEVGMTQRGGHPREQLWRKNEQLPNMPLSVPPRLPEML